MVKSHYIYFIYAFSKIHIHPALVTVTHPAVTARPSEGAGAFPSHSASVEGSYFRVEVHVPSSTPKVAQCGVDDMRVLRRVQDGV